MQFRVPQFLDIEDTIFGPFTFKQFIYLVGGGGLAFIIYKLLGFWLGAIPILIVVGFALLLTFYKPNGKPFIEMVQAAFSYLFQSKLYIWKRKKVEPEILNKKKQVMDNSAIHAHPTRLTGEKLKDLAWSLDILDLKKEKENK